MTKRSFIKLLPAAAVVVAGGAWWFLAQGESTRVGTQGTSGSTSAGFEFPITWNGEWPSTINSNDYRLKVDGDVSNPLELNLQELYAMTGVQKTLTIHCVEGWEADVPWEGIPLPYLLRQAGASPSVAQITISATTGYSTTLSSNEAANLDNMIALRVGGAPLTVDHGYPARLVAPSRPGEDWVKYVSRITCTSD